MDVFEIERPATERRTSNVRAAGGNKTFYLLLLSLAVIFSSGVIFLLHFILEYQRLSHGILVLNSNNAEALSNISCEEQYCDSENCVATASRMLSMVDVETDPCEDFYGYSCGGYGRYKSVPYAFPSYSPAKEARSEILVSVRKLMEESSAPSASRTFQKMKQFYQSCMNKDERDRSERSALSDFFYEIELSLENSESRSGETRSWVQLLSRLEEYQIHTVIETSFRSSEASPIERIEVDCLVPLLPLEVYIDAAFTQQLFVYEDLILKTLEILSMDEIRRKEMASWILQIETNIASSFQKYKSSGPFSIAEEHKLQIREILRPLIGDAVQEVEVVSLCKYHIDSMFSVLNKSPQAMSYTYVAWRMIVQLLPFLGSKLRNLHVQYVAEHLGLHSAYVARWRECADVIRAEFGLAAMQFLMQEDYIEHETIQSLNRTFLELKRSFARTLRSFGSTDSKMGHIFFNKLNTMKLNTGYQKAVSGDRLDEVYRSLEVGDDYFKNVLGLKKFKARYFLMRLWYGNGENKENEISLMRNPLGHEASYDYITNTVNIDIGLLLPPAYIYPKNSTNYLKYGPSSIIAREMSHAFDSTGIIYDADGNIIEKEVWTPALQRKYALFLTCLQNQMLLLNDTITEAYETEGLNQMIADLGSLDISYKAMSSHLFHSRAIAILPGVNWTKRQMFFIFASQMLCELRNKYSNHYSSTFSVKHRVNTIVSNIKGFAAAFHCSSTMVQNQKIRCNFLQ